MNGLGVETVCIVELLLSMLSSLRGGRMEASWPRVTTDMKERSQLRPSGICSVLGTVSHGILLQVQALPTFLHEEILIEENTVQRTEVTFPGSYV